jgi:hypothetical protein
MGSFKENIIKPVLLSGNIKLLKYIEHLKWSEYIDIADLICCASSSQNLNMVKILLQRENINLRYEDFFLNQVYSYLHDIIHDKSYEILEYLLHMCSGENNVKFQICRVLSEIHCVSIEECLWLTKLFSSDCVPWKYLLFKHIETLSPEVIEYIAEFSKMPSPFVIRGENEELQKFQNYIINSNNGEYIRSLLNFTLN